MLDFDVVIFAMTGNYPPTARALFCCEIRGGTCSREWSIHFVFARELKCPEILAQYIF